MKLTPLIGNKSLVGILNILFFQWLFIRLEATVDNGTDRYILEFGFHGFIVPVTGWRTTGEYVYVGPPWRWHLWGETDAERQLEEANHVIGHLLDCTDTMLCNSCRLMGRRAYQTRHAKTEI